MQKINLYGFDVNLSFKKVKRVSITIKAPFGEIFINAPKYFQISQIEQLLLDKKEWILKNQTKIKSRTIIPFDTFKEGDTPYLFLQPININLTHDELFKFYREQLKITAQPLFEKWTKIMNVYPNEWRIKNMKTRYGSCNVLAKRIWINLKLVVLDKSCLELIIVHELCHLIEKSHSKRFYSLLDYYLPNWKNTQNKLSNYYVL